MNNDWMKTEPLLPEIIPCSHIPNKMDIIPFYACIQTYSKWFGMSFETEEREDGRFSDERQQEEHDGED